jgi:hypothetical protein
MAFKRSGVRLPLGPPFKTYEEIGFGLFFFILQQNHAAGGWRSLQFRSTSGQKHRQSHGQDTSDHWQDFPGKARSVFLGVFYRGRGF